MANRIRSLFKNKKDKENTNTQPPIVSKGSIPYTSSNNSGTPIYPRQLVAGTGQSVGLHRDHNEDALFCLTYGLSDGKAHNELGIFIIADGMGGHRNGEIASSVTCRVISRFLMQRIADPPSIDFTEITGDEWQGWLDQAIAESQKAVLQNAPGGGTTVTAVVWANERIYVAQVGDSRAYFVFTDGRLERITKDHSLVQRLVDLNEITESEADAHPQKNVLLRAIGQPDPLKADINSLPVPPGAKLMLCSDGLWGVVNETSITNIIVNENDPIIACERLVSAANLMGGPDNISVIIAGIKG